jgi:hypothetical protein
MRQSTALQIKRGNPRQLILELQLSCTPRSEPVRYFSRMGFGRTVTSKFMASERKMSREPPSSHARISLEYAFTDSIKMVLCPLSPSNSSASLQSRSLSSAVPALSSQLLVHSVSPISSTLRFLFNFIILLRRGIQQSDQPKTVYERSMSPAQR